MMNRKIRYLYKYLKIQSFKNNINLFLFLSISIILIDILFSPFLNIAKSSFIAEIKNVIFNLVIGYIVSYIFYYLTVVIKEIEQKKRTYENIISLNNRLVYDTLNMYLYLFRVYNRKFHRKLLEDNYQIYLPAENIQIQTNDELVKMLIAKNYPYISESLINKFGNQFNVKHLLDHMLTNLESIAKTKPNHNLVSVHNLYFTEQELIEVGKWLTYRDKVDCIKADNIMSSKPPFQYWGVNEYIIRSLNNMKNQITKIRDHSQFLPIDYLELLNTLEQNMNLNFLFSILNQAEDYPLQRSIMELLFIIYSNINELRFAGIRLNVELNRLKKKSLLKHVFSGR
ncbi:MAG: hypothetical protein EKK54_00155 [Neisseriaceae bacterium]|nr:MAG: hypothetical protein EKK54_00155 [Neisseriaceae bacterium]